MKVYKIEFENHQCVKTKEYNFEQEGDVKALEILNSIIKSDEGEKNCILKVRVKGFYEPDEDSCWKVIGLRIL